MNETLRGSSPFPTKSLSLLHKVVDHVGIGPALCHLLTGEDDRTWRCQEVFQRVWGGGGGGDALGMCKRAGGLLRRASLKPITTPASIIAYLVPAAMEAKQSASGQKVAVLSLFHAEQEEVSEKVV